MGGEGEGSGEGLWDQPEWKNDSLQGSRVSFLVRAWVEGKTRGCLVHVANVASRELPGAQLNKSSNPTPE